MEKRLHPGHHRRIVRPSVSRPHQKTLTCQADVGQKSNRMSRLTLGAFRVTWRRVTVGGGKMSKLHLSGAKGK